MVSHFSALSKSVGWGENCLPFLDFVADASVGRVRADAKSGMKRYSSVNSWQWRERFGWMLTANRKPLAFPDMQSVHL